MNPERWQAIGDLFERAVLLPAAEQTAFVDQACASDDELRREVASLLASHRAAPGGFVQHRINCALSLFVETTNAAEHPVRIGPYRLIRKLGRGGMGDVFLAERDDEQYQARVAIKLVRPGMDTDFILARFRRERQTLARLQHPNISRLLDGGSTDQGLPYIVMEYIDGVWLTEYTNARALGIADRLRLFLDVCAAVDYAHRHFIIHRDLKPGNILVDADGAPKLLDFGICKLLRSDAIAVDETIAAPLTPNYASPEQARGDAITPLSDVYSLGAVLYELLCGRPSRQFENLSPHAIAAAFDRPLVPPSKLVMSGTLARQLAGDLDNVVLRALETEPDRRYQSAAELADDLRRYLEHEPVRARPQTTGYRAAKFVRRDRVPVAAAAVVVVALSIGLAVSIYERRLADARLDQVRRMADRLVFEVHDSVAELPGATQARKLIVQTALEFLDSSANAVRRDPRAEAELAKAYRRLGDVQGSPLGPNLGDTTAAQARYARAAALIEDALARRPGDVDTVTERLVLYDRVGQVHIYAGKLPDAVRVLEEGTRFGNSFRGVRSASFLSALASLYVLSSDAKRNMRETAGALQDAKQSLRLFEGAVALDPQPSLRNDLAGAYASVGMAESELNDLQPALEHFRRGASELEALVAISPENTSWNRDLMLAYGHIGDALGNPGFDNLGDRAGALDAYQRAASIGKRLYDADPADQRAAADYGIVLSRVETTMDDTNLPQKIAVQRESLQVLERTARVNPKNVTLKVFLAVVYAHLGDAITATGDREAARDALSKSAAIARQSLDSGRTSLYSILLGAERRLALNAVARGRRAEALAVAGRALEVATGTSTVQVASHARQRGLSAMGLTYAALAQSPLREAGDRQAALTWLGQALESWRAVEPQPGFDVVQRREMRDVEAALARVQQLK